MTVSEWEAVVDFMNILERKPIDGTFKDWFDNSWKPYQTKCINMAKHRYILKKALENFQKKHTHREWHLSFIEIEQKTYLRRLCLEVGIEAEDFIHFGLTHHRNACKTHHNNRYTRRKATNTKP